MNLKYKYFIGTQVMFYEIEVVNEFIVSDAHDTPVEVNLDNLPMGAGIKTKIIKQYLKIK